MRRCHGAVQGAPRKCGSAGASPYPGAKSREALQGTAKYRGWD